MSYAYLDMVRRRGVDLVAFGQVDMGSCMKVLAYSMALGEVVGASSLVHMGSSKMAQGHNIVDLERGMGKGRGMEHLK